MTDRYNLGLYLSAEREKQHALKYLNKATSMKYAELLSKLIDCAYDIQLNKRVEKEHLDAFTLGMKQPLELIFTSYSGKYVAKLSYHFKEAEEVFRTLSNDKSSKVRFNAVTSLLCNPVDSVTSYVIEKCINDESRLVRKKVADVCERIDYIEGLDLLKERYLIETNDSVKRSLNFSIRLLKDGYILEQQAIDKYEILVKTDKGLTGMLIDIEKMKSYSIDSIAKSIREHGKLPWK